MTATNFSGFPPQLFSFLRELKENNNREWFQDNKQRYKEDVAYPVQDFIISMGPKLKKISKYYNADPRTNGGSMFRIYRDARFSRNKEPYKTHVGCQFRHHAGKDAHAPGFYLHLEPNQVLIGGGVWMPPNTVLDQIRQRIIARPDEWAGIVKKSSFINRFGTLRGESLKRPPRGYDSDAPHLVDLKRKSFIVLQEFDESQACGSGFLSDIYHNYKAASPLMAFVTRSMDLPFS